MEALMCLRMALHHNLKPSLRKTFCRGLVLIAMLCFPFNTGGKVGAQTAQMTAIEVGKPLERELSGSQKHYYQITLTAGQYASVTIEQRGIDVVVYLLGTAGKASIRSEEHTSELQSR